MIRQCEFDVWAGRGEVVTCEESLGAALAVVAEEIATADRACSTFRGDSDISRVNAAAGRWVPVDAVFLEALEAALAMAEATAGLVDPTVGTATLATPDVRIRARNSDWRHVHIEGHRVRIPAECQLDLGATAKAWCADRAASRAARHVGVGVLVGLCGDIATAGRAPDGGWVVACADDHRRIAEGSARVSITGGGLATSSTTVRRRRARFGTVAHIVDPRTLTPVAGPWRTVSVAARTCVEANAAATAAIVSGSSAADWLQQLGLAARLVRGDGTVTTAGGWPQ